MLFLFTFVVALIAQPATSLCGLGMAGLRNPLIAQSYPPGGTGHAMFGGSSPI